MTEGIEVSFEHSSPAESYIGVGFGKTTSMQNTDIFTCRRSADTIGVVSSFSAQNGQPKVTWNYSISSVRRILKKIENVVQKL